MIPPIVRRAATLLLLPLLCSFALGAALAGCARCSEQAGREPAEDGLALEYTVEADRPASGLVSVELLLHNLPAGRHVLERGGNPRTTEVLELEARAGERRLTLARIPAKTDRWALTKADEPVVRVRWRARQGGLDRHGHEGYLGAGFGLVDGGVYLVPRDALVAEAQGHRGESPVTRVRVRVKAPGSWQVVSSMRRTADGLFDPAIDGRWPLTHLAHSNTALGAFDRIERSFDGLTVELQLYRPWPARKKSEIAAKAFRIYETFHRQTPCRGLPRYTVIVLPAAPDGQPVTGQMWSIGQAFSFDAYADRPRRFWELLAHRIAHCLNRYSICGMHFDDPLERWFVEGWASWAEVSHTQDVVGSEQRLVELGKAYRSAFFGLHKEARDEAVAAEAEHRAPKQVQYLHYFKAPLVVMQMDYALRRASQGTKTVDGLMAWLHKKHGGHRGSVPLRQELRAYSGQDWTTFFAETVQKPGFLYPVHEGFLQHLRAQPPPPRAALRVDGLALGVGQHARLVRLLNMIGVKDPAAVRERLVQLLLVFAEYQRRKLDAIPPAMIEFADRLPASARLLLFRHQAALLFGSADRLAAWTAQQRRKARVEILTATP